MVLPPKAVNLSSRLWAAVVPIALAAVCSLLGQATAGGAAFPDAACPVQPAAENATADFDSDCPPCEPVAEVRLEELPRPDRWLEGPERRWRGSDGASLRSFADACDWSRRGHVAHFLSRPLALTVALATIRLQI